MSVITIDLPFPPSVNAIWRSFRGRVVASKEAQIWWKLAEGTLYTQRPAWKARISGPFEAELMFDQSKRGRKDLDNLSKLPLDAAQRFGIIDNDRLCERLTSSWGEVDGCRLTLRGLA